jgi:putative transcriptional regulator
VRRERPNQKRASLGDEIVRGLTSMRDDLAKGRGVRGHYTVRTVRAVPPPRRWSAKEVRAVRERLGASQAVFAALLGVSVKTVQSWEQGGKPQPIARRLLDCVRDEPGRWAALLAMSSVSQPAA